MMSVTSVINLCISLLIFIISFLLSIQSNLLWDALYRSFIVSIISFISIYFILVLCKQFDHSNEKKRSSTIDEQRVSGNTNERVEQEETEPEKGGHIDLQTPDDDEDEKFIPLQPQKLNIQNDNQED